MSNAGCRVQQATEVAPGAAAARCWS